LIHKKILGRCSFDRILFVSSLLLKAAV